MIEITDKHQCCGCSACSQRCPVQCIQMKEDAEGFLYPDVNKEQCIDCGLCEKVCPVLSKVAEREPLQVYAAKNLNTTIRVQSSSGGIFTLLAEQVLNQRGVVFGARFNSKWEVVHDYTETIEGLDVFRGSKYVQSFVGDTYKQAENFLKKGRLVLFTGTPCQIKGLKLFLRKEYTNLLTVDFVCHGVPSPKVWNLYLKQISSGMKLDNINFRDKSDGWKNFSFLYKYQGQKIKENFESNLFMKTFLSNLSLRPSCYSCNVKKGKSLSDMTMGDFWGIQHIQSDLDDDLGTSLLMIYSPSVKHMLLGNCTLSSHELEKAVKYNMCITRSVAEPINRAYFFYNLNRTKNLQQTFSKNVDPSLLARIQRYLFRKLNKCE